MLANSAPASVRPSPVRVDVADADHDKMRHSAHIGGALYTVRTWLIQHEHGVNEADVRARQLALTVGYGPLLAEAELGDKEVSCPGRVSVAEEESGHG